MATEGMRIRHAGSLRIVLFAGAVAALAGGCRDRVEGGATPAKADAEVARPAVETQPVAPASEVAARLVDVSGSLAAVRADFNAHRGESRFLTLLSPT
jgi:hypothetical protein